MALTCTCKQCGREVRPGDACPVCGGKLSPAQAHLTWKIVRRPVADWMCWNAVMRIVLPVMAMVLVLALSMQLMADGPAALSSAAAYNMMASMGAVLALICFVLLLVLWLRGPELLICTIDGKGMHIERYLPNPTSLRLLLRLKPLSLLEEHGELPIPLDRADTGWKDIRRVQLWPEKSYIILYSPSWWQCMAVPASPMLWNDALELIRQKIGKKKDVILPYALRDTSAKAPKAAPKPSAPVTKPVKQPAPQPVNTPATRHPKPFDGMDRQQPPQI